MNTLKDRSLAIATTRVIDFLISIESYFLLRKRSVKVIQDEAFLLGKK